MNRIPVDVLSIILADSLRLWVREEGNRGKSEEDAKKVWARVQALALICKSWSKAVHSDGMTRAMYAVMHLEPPRRVWVGGTLRGALKAQCMLRAKEERMIMMEGRKISKMRAPTHQNLGPFPKDNMSLEEFKRTSSLQPEERKRLIEHAARLYEFLKAFKVFAPRDKSGKWAEVALQRYRAFLKLKHDNPHALLIPTGDILYAQIAHILRTEEFEKDGLDGHQSPFDFGPSEEMLFAEAVKATAAAWEKAFPGSRYVALSEEKLVKELKPQKGRRLFAIFRKKNQPFFPAFGPGLERKVDLPRVSIVAQDLVKDLQWVTELEAQLDLVFERTTVVLGEYDGESPLRLLPHLLHSYERFLFLVRQNPDKMALMSPPVFIDLFWHAHILSAERYRVEMQRIIGCVPHHLPFADADTPYPLSPELCQLWKSTFKVDLALDYQYADK